jgi:hypothetical protein
METLLICRHEGCNEIVTLCHAALHELMRFQHFQKIVILDNGEFFEIFSCLKAG